MKIKFELEPGNTLDRNIDIAAALIAVDRLYIEDLEEIAQYLNIYVDFSRRPRPCCGLESDL